MRYDIVGSVLLFASAFMYAARYIAAALFIGPGLRNWDEGLFRAAYSYVGNGLSTWALISLIAGIALLVVGAVVKSVTRRD